MQLTWPQWLAAIAAAAAVHIAVLAGIALLFTPTQASQKTPRGVMVSLDQFDAGPPPAATAASQTPASAAPADEAIPQAPSAGPAPSPEPAAPAQTAAPETAEAVGPEAVDDATASRSDSTDAQGDAASKAQAVTVRSAEASTPVAPEAQTVAQPVESGPEHQPEQDRDHNGAYGSSAQTTDDYIVQLRAWLSRHRIYPDSARQDGIQGTVELYLVIDSDGNVLRHRIRHSSGAPVLDEAARQMLERAEPLPRMPASMQRNRLEVVVPITFTLD